MGVAQGKVTASALERVGACVGSAVLPHFDHDSGDAARGTVIHAFLAEAFTTGDAEQALANVPRELRDDCRCIDLRTIGQIVGGRSKKALQPEVAFAWNPDPDDDRAIVLGSMSNRDYSRAPGGWLCGTTDLVSVQPDKVVVVDFKTGMAGQAAEWNPQVGFQCVAAAGAYDRQKAVGLVVRIINGDLSHSKRVMESMELDAVKESMRTTLSRVDVAASTVAMRRTSNATVEEAYDGFLTTGRQCSFCPAFLNCPATKAALGILRDTDLIDLDDKAVMRLHAQIPHVERAIEMAKSALKERVLRHPVNFPDGRVLRVNQETRRQIRAEKAFPILADELGTDAAILAVRMTIEGVNAAANDAGKSGAAVMAKLEAAGAVKSHTIDVVRAVRVKQVVAEAPVQRPHQRRAKR